MVVSKGYNNFANADTDTAIIGNVEAFLNSYVNDANNHSTDLYISNQIKGQHKP